MSLNSMVIASDFSKHAEYALQRALSLAEQHHSSLHVLNVVRQSLSVGFARFSGNEQQKKLLELEKSTKDKLSALTKKYSFDVPVTLAVSLGRAADEIIRYAEKNQCHLILAGAHGQYHINDHILGTTSGDIVRQGSTPVLLTKNEPVFSYDRILIATDFSEVSKKAVEFAFQCFPNATFQLLHIVDIYYSDFLNSDDDSPSKNEKTKDILEKLDDFLKRCKVKHEKFDKKIIGGYLADAIVIQSEKWNADLLVFGAQGHSKLHYFLMGSVAKRLLQLSSRDMLVIPPAPE